MNKIIRQFYLEKMFQTMNSTDIKVITGIRRSGKSVILKQFLEEIQKNKNTNIIFIDYSLKDFSNIMDELSLYDYVSSKYIQEKQNFLLVDEVQMCKNFEKAINWFYSEEKYNIYITGSNAFLLSSDLATLFTGRTFSIDVYPFSFSEFLTYHKIDYSNRYSAFLRYLKEGGMSGSYVYNDEINKFNYLNEVFDTLIIRDIRQKYQIKDIELLNRIIDFMVDNSSNLISSRKISDTLTSNQNKVNHTTVGKYISYLCNSFAFYKISRYDIKGKKYLTSNDKYYLADYAIRYAKLGTKNINFGYAMENIVAIELLRRGYEIYVGKLYSTEIDFIAKKQNEQIYIQVTQHLENEDTFNREVNPLLKIRDAYPKIIITRSMNEPYQYEGIKIIDIADWLLEK